MARAPEYLGDPTLGRVMRRPQWILALLLALLVAAVFAWLGRWQLDTAISDRAGQTVDTETARPLASVSEPATGVTDEAGGVVVELGGAYAPGDFVVVSPRDNGGETGAWVVGHLVADGTDSAAGASLAVAVGWAPTAEKAETAIAALDAHPELLAEQRPVTGRLMPTEAAAMPDADADPQSVGTMVPAQVANLWAEVDGPVYAGYLVLHDGDAGADALLAAAGLDAIDSMPPEPAERVNWLNVFYAIEWVVFAGFAVFLWYRLARDAWEREHEMQLLEAEDAAGAAGPDPDPEPSTGSPRSDR